MKIFALPDLGEGLPDAQIREWYVRAGDEVVADQPLAAMETAKALVDVPAPFAGRIEKLFGAPGDTIETGAPLVGFEGVADTSPSGRKDTGTVVGVIEESGMVWEEGGAATASPTQSRVKITPAVRQLAKQLGVDLSHVMPSVGDVITAEDVHHAKQRLTLPPVEQAQPQPVKSSVVPEGYTALSPVRRAMTLSMTEAHQSVVPVTLMDDADLHAWSDTPQDLTIRLIRAIEAACAAEPTLNAYFDSTHCAIRTFSEVNLGIAVDTPHGLYVPVLRDTRSNTNAELRASINRFKVLANDRRIPQESLHGATIMLSNYGALAGCYATPLLVPPIVAIIGVGRKRDMVVAWGGQPAVHSMLPVSLTIDHRAVTGGEAARFLKALIDSLSAVTG